MSFLGNLTSDNLQQAVAQNQQYLDPIRQYILDHFGQNGLTVAYILVGAIALLVVWKLIKLSFELIFFVAIPSVLAAVILSSLLPYSFFYLLPATTALFTLGLIFRTVAAARK